MKILIIDQCSGDKTYPDWAETYGADEIDATPLAELRTRDETVAIRAQDLYAGRQQQYITRAIEQLESRAGDTVSRYFISAGFGLVGEDEQLPPYNVTFNDYSSAEIEERAEKLGIEERLFEVLTAEYDVVFFPLGSSYYQTFDLSSAIETIPTETLVVCFNCESEVSDFDNAVSIPARTEQAKEQGAIVVALKGKYIQNFAEHRAHGQTVSGIEDIEAYCVQEYATQSDFGAYEN